MTPPKAALIVFPSNIGLMSFEIGFDVLVFGSMFSIINAGIAPHQVQKMLEFLKRTVSYHIKLTMSNL